MPLLLDAGANPNALDADAWTPLYLAARYPRIVAQLLDRGARHSIRDRFGDTALHRAAGLGQRQSVTLLLARGADPNVQNGAGRTPLHSAVAVLGTRVLDLLVQRGARQAIKDKSGRTAYQLALRQGKKDAAQLLFKLRSKGF